MTDGETVGRPPGCSLLGASGVGPMSLLALTARDGERMFRDKLGRLCQLMEVPTDPACVTMEVAVGPDNLARIREIE